MYGVIEEMKMINNERNNLTVAFLHYSYTTLNTKINSWAPTIRVRLDFS